MDRYNRLFYALSLNFRQDIMYNRFAFQNYINSRKHGFDSSFYDEGVNFDYIATVSKKNPDTDEVVYKQVPIKSNNKDLLEKAYMLFNNEENTVLDIHELCVSSIPGFTRSESFSCCLPYEYNRSYINYISETPRSLMFNIGDKEKYTKFIADIKDDFITTSLREYSLDYSRDRLSSKEREDIYKSEEKFKQWEAKASMRFKTIKELPIDENSDKIKKRLENFEQKEQRNHKRVYLDALQFWLLAANYFDTLKQVLEDDSVCMYSLENVGWHSYTYPVHGDFEFIVNTNFCYGSASYFHIVVKYKGVKILPYSQIVSYYHANMVSFLSCTRAYNPYRSNWDVCFKYIEGLINEACLDEAKFIEKWVKRELQIMIDGLKSILEQPHAYLENCLEHPLDEQKKDSLVSVSNMTDCEFQRYKIYREEMTIAFQSEKITDSIRLIDNLKQLTAVIPDVQSTIETIIGLNKAAKPIFDDAICSLEEEIENRKSEISKLKERLSAVKKACAEYAEECDAKWQHQSDKSNLDFEKFNQDFIKENKEYEDLLKEKETLSDSIDKSLEDVENRNRFKSNLKDCTKKISKFLSE